MDHSDRWVSRAAPRMFGVVLDDPDDLDDPQVLAWGMEFGDRAEVVSVEGGTRMGLGTAQAAVRLFSLQLAADTRLVWVRPMDLNAGS